jgi:hypothetical protein
MTSEVHAGISNRRGRLLFEPGAAFQDEILRPLLSSEAYENRSRFSLGSAAITAAIGTNIETPTHQAFGPRLPNSWRTAGTRIGIRSVSHGFDKTIVQDEDADFIYSRVFYYFRLAPSHARALTGLVTPSRRMVSLQEFNDHEGRKERELAATALGFAVLNHELPYTIQLPHDVEEQVRHMNALLADKEATVPPYYYVNGRPDIVELY